MKSRCLLATTFSGAVAVPPAGTLSVRSRLTACPVTARTLLSRHVTRPAIGPSRVDQAPDPALDLIGAGAGLLELERASEAVRARRELVLARDRRRRARTQRAGRGRVALELGAQRRAAERPGEDALHGDGRHERALAAAARTSRRPSGARRCSRAFESTVPSGLRSPTNSPDCVTSICSPVQRCGGRRHVVAAGDRGLRLLVAAGREHHDDDDDRHRSQDRVVDDQPPCGRGHRGDCIRGPGGQKVNFFARSRRRARRAGRTPRRSPGAPRAPSPAPG